MQTFINLIILLYSFYIFFWETKREKRNFFFCDGWSAKKKASISLVFRTMPTQIWESERETEVEWVSENERIEMRIINIEQQRKKIGKKEKSTENFFFWSFFFELEKFPLFFSRKKHTKKKSRKFSSFHI